MNLDSRAVMLCRICTCAGIGIAAIVGGPGLLGWILGIEALKSLGVNDFVIKANTATCLLLAGISLYCLHEHTDNKTFTFWGRLLGAVVCIVGILTFSEHVIGWNLGIDQLLFREMPERRER